MPKVTCSIDDCERPTKSRGLCGTHAERLRLTGSTDRPSVAVRFWAKIDVRGPDECWPCLCRDRGNGYRRVQIDGETMGAHRFAYELTYGPLPADADVDHRCHNADPECLGGYTCPHRACCNPAHLRQATRSENMRAGLRAERQGTCVRGHPWTEQSTYIVPSTGHRRCRICRRMIRRD